MTVALLVFWLLDYFTFVNIHIVAEGDPRTGWVGERGCSSRNVTEVCEAG